MPKLTAYALADKYHMLSRDEVALLKQCARRLPTYPVIVNIGAGAGTSALAILEERPDAVIFSVDRDPVPEEPQALAQAGLDPYRCLRILGTSWRVGKHWIIPLDMLVMDGPHHDKGVQADIDVWLKHVKPGGVVLFHDVGNPVYLSKPGVHLDKIVSEAMQGKKRLGEARYLVAFEV